MAARRLGDLVLALGSLLVVERGGPAGGLDPLLEVGGLLLMLCGRPRMLLGYGSVELGLGALGLGNAAELAGAGDVRIGLVAVSERLAREALVLELTLGRAMTQERDEQPDDDDRGHDDDDDRES